MEKINIAKLLKDCPKDMELDCTMFDDVKFIAVDEAEKPLCIRTGDIYRFLTEFGTWTFDENAKCVIFPKGKTTWEGFVPPCKFKDGDIVATEHGLFIGIVKVKNNIQVNTYCLINEHGFFTKNINYGFERFATEEEKQKLFDAIKANDYKWNEETKTLEKLVEPKFKVGNRVRDKSAEDCHELCELVSNKFDINTLKPFDKVLVRNDNGQKWTVDLFSFHDKDLIYEYACAGHYVNQCIPYKGNEYLLGTNNECKEYYKTWK